MIDTPSTDWLARIAVALERIASALEGGAFVPREAVALDPRAQALTDLRHLIRDREFPRASLALGDFEIDYPDAPEIPALSEELAEKIRSEIDDLQERLAATRKANDPDAALTLRNSLAPLLSAIEREAVDRDILSWLMSNLMRRLRTGTVRADVRDPRHTHRRRLSSSSRGGEP